LVRPRLTALVLVAVAGCVAAVLALSGGKGHHAAPAQPQARPAHALEVALQDDPVFVRRAYFDRDRAFARARELGVTWLRMNVLWHRVVGAAGSDTRAPSALVYDWTSYDVAIRAARAHGIEAELTLTGPAPAWAVAGGRVGNDRPNAGYFADFARAAAVHFRGLGVRRYSIWNEPNHLAWLSPLSEAPAIYRRLYTAGYHAIKSVEPQAQVLIGETAPYTLPGSASAPLRFLRAVACATPAFQSARGCSPLRADGYAHHPYEFTRPPERPHPGADNVTIGSLDRLTGALDRLAAAGLLSTPSGRPLPVYLTEFGYFRRGRRVLPPARRAAYLTRAFDIAARRYPRVRQMLQYLLVSPPPDYPGGRFDTSILLRSDAPTPSFTALSAWARAQRRFGRIAP
jgi:hypothetical protein